MSENSQKKGLAIILSAPSGGGKSSIARALLAKDTTLVRSISATTRKPRPGDIDGKDYFFKSKNDFLKMINEGKLLEYSEVYGNLYGIPKDFVETQLQQGHDIIFDIDIQGAQKLKTILQNAVVSIFISPPSIQELRKRLEARKQDSPEEIDLRVNLATKQIEHAKNYDHVIVNNDFLTSVNAIYDFIKSERKKREV
ncbi:MAG TPA: guanylate kinase [Candidatus Megaira endosymbiont of Stentor roeselii]|nr:guanylate kinase [Candidatus Megaera endosymbiont of Stentor roeselii]